MLQHILILIWNKRRKNALLFLEIILASVILIGVFSFIILNFKTFNTPLGFESKDKWIAHLDLKSIGDSTAINQAKETLKRELISLPEIETVSYCDYITPFTDNSWSSGGDQNGFHLESFLARVDENFDQAIGLNIIEGRWFREEDKNEKYLPIVITKKLRDTYFKDRLFLDSIIILEGEHRIVGVVDHYKYWGEFAAEKPLTFTYPRASYNKIFGYDMMNNLIISLKAGTTPAFEEKVNEIITAATNKNFAIDHIEAKRIESSRSSWVLIITLLGICAFLIINIALGLFGVLWYTIQQRQGEIGIRRALGASKVQIALQFGGEIMMVTITAMITVAFFIGQIPLLDLLPKDFPIKTEDIVDSMILSTLIILTLVFICTFFPGRQAMQIPPAMALKEE